VAVADGVTRRARTAVALIAAAGAVALGAWWLGRDERTRLAPRDGNGEAARESTDADAEGGADRGAPVELAQRDDIARSDTGAPASEPADSRTNEGSGAIELRVVDAVDGSPVGDLPFVAWSEQPKAAVFLRGVTDAKGEATIERLPAAIVIVETARRAPCANGVGATRIEPGQRKPLELRLGRGGSVRGRVVDDLGRPLAGVQVGVDPRPGGSALGYDQAAQPITGELFDRHYRTFDAATTTGAEGRYEFGALRSRPVAIAIGDDGAMVARREDEVAVLFRWRQRSQQLKTRVADGETVDLRDVVIERSRTFAGRVVDDASGTPIAGALVTADAVREGSLGRRPFDRPRELRHDLDLAPWEPGFTLAAEEAITTVDGIFEISSTRDEGGSMLAIAPDWRRTTVKQPKVAPGGRVDGIELRLPTETQLFLDLREPDGKPPTSRWGSRPHEFVRALVTTRDGAEVEGRRFDAGATTVGVAFRAAPEAIATLSLRSQEHRPIDHRFASPPTGRPTLAFTLVRKESFELKLRVRPADAEQRALLDTTFVTLGVSALPLAALSSSDGGDWNSQSYFDLRSFEPASTGDFDFFVPARRAWHVYAMGPFGENARGRNTVDLGTFEPDGERHEVVLPPVSAAWRAAQEKRAPRVAEEPAAPKPKPGIVGAIVIDATTRERIAASDVFFLLTAAPAATADPAKEVRRGVTRRSALGIEWDTVTTPAGDYSLRAGAKGYRPSPPRPLTVVADAPVDAGTFELEPLPHWRIQLVESDGSPATSRWQVERCEADKVVDGPVSSDASGLVTLAGDLPPIVALRLTIPSATPFSSGVAPIDLELPAWPSGTTATLRLPPRGVVAIELDLAAVAPDLIEYAWKVTAVRDSATGRATEARYVGGTAALTEPIRHFELTLPPGRWLVRSRAALYVADDAVVEIDADGKVVDERSPLRLTARPR